MVVLKREKNMLLEGVVQNGMIILKDGASLPDGTRVQVSIDSTSAGSAGLETDSNFFRSATMDELAAVQGVTSPAASWRSIPLGRIPKRALWTCNLRKDTAVPCEAPRGLAGK